MRDIQEFCKALGSVAPTPGGGAAAGINLSLGAACAEKAARFSLTEDHDECIKTFVAIREKGIILSDADQEAFSSWQNARKLPKETDEEKKKRTDKINHFVAECINVPFEICKQSLLLVDTINSFLPNCNKWLISDACIGALFARSAFDAGIFNVDINMPYLKDKNLMHEVKEFLNKETSGFNVTVDDIIVRGKDLMSK